MATENARWGYTRIQGALGNLDYHVGRGTIPRILLEKGLEPSRKRFPTDTVVGLPQSPLAGSSGHGLPDR